MVSYAASHTQRLAASPSSIASFRGHAILHKHHERPVSATQLPLSRFPLRTHKLASRRGTLRLAATASGEQVVNGWQAAGVPLALPTAQDAVMGFIAALNARDWSALGQWLSADCVLQNMSCDRPALGRQAVGRFYADMLNDAGISDATRIIIEDMTQGDPSRVGLTWHIELEGVELPVTKGISFYTTNQQGLICSIRENPEHFLKMGHLAAGSLGLAAPLVRTLGPAALPAFWFSLLSNKASSATSPLSPAPAGKWFMSPDHLNSPLASLAAPDYRMQLQQRRQLEAAGGLIEGRGPAVLPELFQELFASAVAASPFGAASSGVSSSGSGVGSSSSSSGVSSSGSRGTSNGIALTRGGSSSGSGSSGGSRRGVEVRFRSNEGGGVEAASTTPNGFNTSNSKDASDGESSSDDGSRPEASTDSSTAQAANQVDGLEAAYAAPVHVAGQEAAAAISAATSPAEVAAAGAAEEEGHQAEAPVPGTAAEPVNLHGIWKKDLEASEVDEYEKALDLWHISGMQKATARLIEGLDIVYDGNTFQVHFLTIIPQNLFKVTEKFVIGGTTNIMRRDLRRGQCKSTASSLPNGILVQMQWADPYAGSLEECYVCPEGDAGVLHVVSTISIGGTSITTTQVFRRHKGSKEALLQESEQRNGSAKDVLGRFGMKMPGFGMTMPGF